LIFQIDQEAGGGSESSQLPLEKPFECSHCAKRFVKKSRLEWHLRMHNNERPFPCTADGCTKAFFANQTLRAHLRQVHHENLPALRHTGPRPLSPSNDNNGQHQPPQQQQQQPMRMPSVSEVVERLSAAESNSVSGRDSVMSDISQSSVVVIDPQHEAQRQHQHQQHQQHQSQVTHLQEQQQQQQQSLLHQQQLRHPILPITESFHPMANARSRFQRLAPHLSEEAILQQHQQHSSHAQLQQQQQQQLQSRSLLEQRQQQLMEAMKDMRSSPLAARAGSITPGIGSSISPGSVQFPSHSFVLQQQHERHVQEQLLLQQQQQQHQQQQQRLQQQQQRQHQVLNELTTN
jgi:hypothetical protein